MTIIVVGLGPGDGRYVTRQAWEILSSVDTIYLRTSNHPAVDDLPTHVRRISFDQIYESADSFEEVYDRITNELLQKGIEANRFSKSVVYAVPGHPMIGESTVTRLLSAAEDSDIRIEVVPGLSFIEPALLALGHDGLDGLQLFDSLEIAGYNHPPLNTDVPLLLGQLYNQQVASELKLALMALYPDEHEVVLVHAAGMVSQSIEHVPLFNLDRTGGLGHLSCLFVPALPNSSTLQALADTVAYLRGPDGCPWDQEQTSLSMRAGFLDETYEALDAIEAGDSDALCEELGDVLYHLVMQAQIATEHGEFRLSDVIAGIDAKLRRRHPHVWGDWDVEGSEEVVHNWEVLKDQEKSNIGKDYSLVDDIPQTLPSLARSQKLQERVKRIGFDWSSVSGVVDKLDEELAELRTANTQEEIEYELGDVLFTIVNWARWLGVEAEISLREANIRFERRFRRLEKLAEEEEATLSQLDPSSLDRLWEAAKLADAKVGRKKESE